MDALSYTSGFQNLNFVKAVQHTVNDIMKCYDAAEQKDGNTNNILYKEIVNIISATQKEIAAPQRVEPDGIHFIEQGEALVLGSDVMPLTRLSKCDDFGMCEILRRTGPEFLGDIRAGLTMVKTFYVKYDDIRKRLTYTEKVRLQEIEERQNNKDALINLIS